MHYANETQVYHRKAVGRYLDFLGKKSVVTADHADVWEYMAKLSDEGAGHGVLYTRLGVLRVFYDFLRLGGLVTYASPRILKMRPPPHGAKFALTESQMKRLISAAQTARDVALVEFLYGTGCRLSEARNLKIEDIDFGTKTATVRGKRGKLRQVLLTPQALDALHNYISSRRKGLVFLTMWRPQGGCLYLKYGSWASRYPCPTGGRKWHTHGSSQTMSYLEARAKHDALMARQKLVRPSGYKPLTKQGIQSLVAKIGERAGLKGVTPHTFRRTFATHLYEHGAPLDIIRALMGHAWIHTTIKYVHTSPGNLTRTFENCHPRRRLNVELQRPRTKTVNETSCESPAATSV